MVCKKCEKKLSKVAAPDPFTSSSDSIKAGTRKVGELKLSKKNRFSPYQGKCKDCKQSTSQNSAKYCHNCAYRKGVCAMCGKQVLDTSSYVMSTK